MPSLPMEKNPAWKGGRTIARGYVRVMRHGNPRAHNGYVYEHICPFCAQYDFSENMAPKKSSRQEAYYHRECANARRREQRRGRRS